MPQIGVDRPQELGGWDEPESPRITRVRDLLVIPSPGHRAQPQEWLDNPPVEEAVDLGNGVFVERLRDPNDDVAEQVIHASIPRGLHHDPTRQFGQMYSFWRDVPETERRSSPAAPMGSVPGTARADRAVAFRTRQRTQLR